MGLKRNFFNNYVIKEGDKVLSDINYSVEDADKVRKLEFDDSYTNLIITKNLSKRKNVIKTDNEDGSVSIKVLLGSSSNSYQYFYYYLEGITFKKNHKYYVSLDMIVNKDTLSEGETSSGGNFYGGIIPKYSDPLPVGTGSVKSGVVHGTRGMWKAEVTIDEKIDDYPEAKGIFIQLGRYTETDEFDGIIYNAICIDLGEIDTEGYIPWESVDAYLEITGGKSLIPVKTASYAFEAGKAKVADTIKEIAVGRDIDLWGNSLTAQNYGQYLKEITGRNVFTHGYGGKTSTYIRDEFKKGYNPDRTQVIWVGRNNCSEIDVVIDDIRDMVETFGKPNFIIMPPPNGYYGEFGAKLDGTDGTGEMRGGDKYQKFIELTEKLQSEYPANFLDIRKSCIAGWRMGNVKLLSSFVQPAAGANVQISVSDANFLTTYNTSDETKFGIEFMSHIRIGLNGVYDKYKVISKDSDTLITVQLVDAESYYKNPGQTVDNIVDGGGNTAIKYLRIMQEADYLCYLYDTTLSTFRSDGIHMKADGLRLVAINVSRKLEAMKI